MGCGHAPKKCKPFFAPNQHLPIKYVWKSIYVERISIKIALKGNLNLIYIRHFDEFFCCLFVRLSVLAQLCSPLQSNGLNLIDFQPVNSECIGMNAIKNDNKIHKSILMISKKILNLECVCFWVVPYKSCWNDHIFHFNWFVNTQFKCAIGHVE